MRDSVSVTRLERWHGGNGERMSGLPRVKGARRWEGRGKAIGREYLEIW